MGQRAEGCGWSTSGRVDKRNGGAGAPINVTTSLSCVSVFRKLMSVLRNERVHDVGDRSGRVAMHPLRFFDAGPCDTCSRSRRTHHDCVVAYTSAHDERRGQEFNECERSTMTLIKRLGHTDTRKWQSQTHEGEVFRRAMRKLLTLEAFEKREASVALYTDGGSLLDTWTVQSFRPTN